MLKEYFVFVSADFQIRSLNGSVKYLVSNSANIRLRYVPQSVPPNRFIFLSIASLTILSR